MGWITHHHDSIYLKLYYAFVAVVVLVTKKISDFSFWISTFKMLSDTKKNVPLRSVKWTIRFVDRRSHRHTTFTVTVHLTCLRLILLIVSCFWDGDLWFHLLLNLPASLRWWFWWNNPQQTQKESPYESVLFIKETQVCICTENFLRKT